VPKKTKLYVEQTQRERDQATEMHRIFQVVVRETKAPLSLLLTIIPAQTERFVQASSFHCPSLRQDHH
jgi:hypothetical protein